MFGCVGVWVCRVTDILEGQKGDQGGGPKMAKIQYGLKPDIKKRAVQKRPIFGGATFQHFGPRLRPKKYF